MSVGGDQFVVDLLIDGFGNRLQSIVSFPMKSGEFP